MRKSIDAVIKDLKAVQKSVASKKGIRSNPIVKMSDLRDCSRLLAHRRWDGGKNFRPAKGSHVTATDADIVACGEGLARVRWGTLDAATRFGRAKTTAKSRPASKTRKAPAKKRAASKKRAQPKRRAQPKKRGKKTR